METVRKLMPGNSSFMGIMQGGYYYVDKSLFIKELLDNPAMVTLITRPRRFGKTLNMDMLRSFFESGSGARKYFESLKIWKCGERYTALCEACPVIYLSFKDVRGSRWDDMYEQFCDVISDEAARLKEKGFLDNTSEIYIRTINSIIDGTAGEKQFRNSLKMLCKAVEETCHQKVIILIDEYDVPIHEAHEKGYYEKTLSFEKTWLSGGLKDNSSLAFAVVTGVLRISGESIFSDLNNLSVYTVTSERYASQFGFTADDVQKMCEDFGVPEKMEEIRQWYDGYRFGNCEIYNPWSVSKFFSENFQARTYWNQTSRNALLRSMLGNVTPENERMLCRMLEGQSCETVISDDISYERADRSSLEVAPSDQTALFTLLVMTGYLRVCRTKMVLSATKVCDLEIPNKEIRSLYAEEILDKCRPILPAATSTKFERALRCNDINLLSGTMREFLLQSTSAHDLSHEAFYQGMVSGLCAVMYDDYYLSANLESGEGRYDIQLKPKKLDRTAILIELKVDLEERKKEDLSEVLKGLAAKALDQIVEKYYYTDLKQYGCKNILAYGMAFKGKRVEVQSRVFSV